MYIYSGIPSALPKIFLFYNEINFIKNNINFFRYLDNTVVLNCDSFENISFSIYPKELALKNITSSSFISFLDLKINLDTYNTLNFDFTVNNLTNQFSSIQQYQFSPIKFLKVYCFCKLLELRK